MGVYVELQMVGWKEGYRWWFDGTIDRYRWMDGWMEQIDIDSMTDRRQIDRYRWTDGQIDGWMEVYRQIQMDIDGLGKQMDIYQIRIQKAAYL